MSKIADLRNVNGNSVNVIDFIVAVLPEGIKPKYIEMFHKLLKSACEISFDRIKSKRIEQYRKEPFYVLLISGIEKIISSENVVKFVKFTEFNEMGIVEKNDITAYKSFEEVFEEYQKAQAKIEEKELEKEIHKIYEDDEWLILKPLSYKSSLKYGSMTKWCTAAKSDTSAFERYTRDGILIYCISRKTDKRVAFYEALNNSTGSSTLSCFDEKDVQVDSLKSGLPLTYLQIIIDDIGKNRISNKALTAKKKLESVSQTDRSITTAISGSILNTNLEPIFDRSSGKRYGWNPETNEIIEIQ